MKRKIIAVVAGIVSAFVVMIAVEMIGSLIFPMPSNIDITNREAMTEYMSNMSIGAYLMVALGWVLSSFAGGFVVTKISKEQSVRFPLFIGMLLTIGGVINFILLPHPVWFMILGFLIFIPISLIGHQVAKDKI